MKKGKNILCVIGIDNYKNVVKLNNAVRDSKKISELLWKKYNFKSENTYSIFDEKATRKNIYYHFRKLAEQVTENDNLLIYFAGHGYFDLTLNMGYWLPYEAFQNEFSDYIANNEIINFIKVIKSKHTFLIADACFAGSLFVNNRRLLNQKIESYSSRWAFASGRMEVVADGHQGDNSPFAKSLIKVLDQNNEREIRVSEIILKVQILVGNNFKQTPQGAPLYGVGDEGGEMIFHLKEDIFDDKEWEKTVNIDTIEKFKQYLKKHPKSNYTEDAKKKIENLKEKEKLDKIEKFVFSLCKSQENLKEFIILFPNGNYTDVAVERIRTVNKGFIQEIKNRISKGETAKALNEAIDYLSTKNIKSPNELILLTSRFHSLQNNRRKGIIQFQDYQLEINKINQGFLFILNEIEENLKIENQSNNF